MRIIIVIEWSWKKISCSMIGELALGKEIFDHVLISYLIIMLIWLNVCSEGGKFNCHSVNEGGNWEKMIWRFLHDASHKI